MNELPPSCIDATALAPDLALGDALLAAKTALASPYVSAFVTWPKYVQALHREFPELPLAAVIGFPDGAAELDVKRFEAERAVASGAVELDWVLDRGDAPQLEDEVAAALGLGAKVKAIIEAPMLPRPSLASTARLLAELGVPVIKTASGRWGATTPAMVRGIAAVVAPFGAQVKAAGGVRARAQALAMLQAGASLVGTSTVAVWSD